MCDTILALVCYDDILKCLLFSILSFLEIFQVSHLFLTAGSRIQVSVPVTPIKAGGVVGVGGLGLSPKGWE